MARKPLDGMRVAALVADGFEQKEFTEPKEALEQAGAKVDIVSPEKGQVQGMHHDVRGDRFPVDVPLDQADSSQYDALLLPGGVFNPDKLRIIEKALEFVSSFDKAEKPIAVICHGPWTMISARVVKGRTLTSYPSVRDDLMNAGCNWVDKSVVVDRNYISSRYPPDIPDFVHETIQRFHIYLDQKKLQERKAA